MYGGDEMDIEQRKGLLRTQDSRQRVSALHGPVRRQSTDPGRRNNQCNLDFTLYILFIYNNVSLIYRSFPKLGKFTCSRL